MSGRGHFYLIKHRSAETEHSFQVSAVNVTTTTSTEFRASKQQLLLHLKISSETTSYILVIIRTFIACIHDCFIRQGRKRGDREGAVLLRFGLFVTRQVPGR